MTMTTLPILSMDVGSTPFHIAWVAVTNGDRINDIHLTNAEKIEARETTSELTPGKSPWTTGRTA